MGFLYHAIRIPKALTLTFFLNIFAHARFLFIGALTRLGLYKPPPEEESDSRDTSNNYIFILDGPCPSLVPIPIHVVTAAIKNRVPVVQYQDFVLQHKGKEETDEDDLCGEKICTICLECIEMSHEIRELCRCSHLFHRECLDTWIDEGQVYCPLCRSLMLPPRTNLNRSCNENRDGMVRSNAQSVDS